MGALGRFQAISDVEDVNPLTEELAATGEIPFELVESFPAEALVETENFRSLFHYYGILSMAERREGMTYFKIPNACVERQLFNYLRDSYRRVKRPDWIGWTKLASAMAYRGDWEPFLRRLAEDFAATTPIRGVDSHSTARDGVFLINPHVVLSDIWDAGLLEFDFERVPVCGFEKPIAEDGMHAHCTSHDRISFRIVL